MTTWYTADTHFNHANIIRYCNRPFSSAREMDRALIRLWNERVKDGDLVIHVGDFLEPRGREPRSYLKHLNGTIILIRGNHDSNQAVRHMPFWTHSMEVNIESFRCLVTHKPYYPKNMQGGNDKFRDHNTDIQFPQNYDFIISGHIHEKRLWSGKSINVGVDQHDYAPISERDLLQHLLNWHEGKGKW